MRANWIGLIRLGLAVLASAGPCVARAQVLDPVLYKLVPGSVLEFGCLGACACPVVISGPVTGGFTFYRTGVDPLFTHYALLNIDWSYTIGDAPGGGPRVRHVRGSGTYDWGGEFALVDRLTLDLITDDTLSQHFDSGFHPVHAAFPVIDAVASLRVNACIDSQFRVVAAPFGLASTDAGQAAGLLRRQSSNPAAGDVEFRLSAPASGPARVDVVDVRGSLVATLLDRALARGEYRVLWDGRARDGGRAAPGVYWARAQVGGRVARERVVLLRAGAGN